MKNIIIAFLIFVLSLHQLQSQTFKSGDMNYQVEEIVRGLDDALWGMVFISDHEILVSKRSAELVILNVNNRTLKAVTGLPKIMVVGQGGLLDVAVPKNYKAGGWIYCTYVKNQNGQGVTTLARAKLDGINLVEWQDLLVTKSDTDTDRHFGSRIVFDGEGYLFFGVGDRGVRPNAQDLTVHAGKIMRLNMDGSVPVDNPFINQKDVLSEIWSYGHRNPQGMFYDLRTKQLWSNEHGPRGGDEINRVQKGKNYGWPVISYGKEYWGPVSVGEDTIKTGMEQPVKYFVPSIAPSSLMIYSGKAFPAWKGNFFSGALVLMHLNRIQFDKNYKVLKEERLLKELTERIRCVIESPEGWIYISTDSGKIFRIVPENKRL